MTWDGLSYDWRMYHLVEFVVKMVLGFDHSLELGNLLYRILGRKRERKRKERKREKRKSGREGERGGRGGERMTL